MDTCHDKHFLFYHAQKYKDHSVNQVANMITNGVHDFEYIPPRPAEARETLANISKAKKLLGYMPSIDLSDWIDEHNI